MREGEAKFSPPTLRTSKEAGASSYLGKGDTTRVGEVVDGCMGRGELA